MDVLPVDRVTGKPGMLSQCRRVEIWHLNSSLVLSQPLRKSTSGLSNIDLRTVNAVYNTRLLEIGHLVLRFGHHLPEGQKMLEANSNLQGSLDMSQAFRYSLNIWDDSHSSPFRCRCRSNSRRSLRGVKKGFWVAIRF